MTPTQPIIRRNPTPRREPAPAYCAIHGAYPEPDAVAALLFNARQPGVQTHRARAMLEESQRLRRRCPHCNGPAATTWTPNPTAAQTRPGETDRAAMARTYAHAGWRVFPCWWTTSRGVCACPTGVACKSPGKHPLYPPAHPRESAERVTCRGECGHLGHGLYDATTHQATIAEWWTSHPHAHIGLPADANKLAILDVDPDKGGNDSYRRLRTELSRRSQPIPFTLTQKTGSGGRHYLFTAPTGGIKGGTNVFGPDMPGLDTRGRGGYIIAAPSGHRSGGRYEWINFFTDPAPWPPILTRLMEPARPQPTPTPTTRTGTPTNDTGTAYVTAALDREVAAVRDAAPGTRNDTLNRAAYNLGTLVGAGRLDEHHVRRELHTAALTAGLGDRESINTILSGLRNGQTNPRRP